MNDPRIKKSLSKIKTIPTHLFLNSEKRNDFDSISKYVNYLIKYNNVSANSLAEYYGISAAQMNKITSGKLDDPSPIQAAKFCNDFKLNLATLRFLLPNKDELFFFDVENKLVNNIKFSYFNDEQYKGTITEKQYKYINQVILNKIYANDKINTHDTSRIVWDKTLELANTVEFKNVIDKKLTYTCNDSIINVGLIFLPNRNRKTRPNYWDDDLRDFSNSLIDIISNNDAINDMNYIFYVTSSIYVYNKISNKFKDKAKRFNKNVYLIYIDSITNNCLILDIFSKSIK